MILDFDSVDRVLSSSSSVSWRGRVSKVQGLVVHAHGVRAQIGAIVEIVGSSGVTKAEVVGFIKETTLLMPFGDLRGVSRGSAVQHCAIEETIPSAGHLLGRVIDPFGCPLDSLEPIVRGQGEPLQASAPPPLLRQPITHALDCGIRVLNAFVTFGVGQRIGIFAGAGVGKSTLLGMLARHVDCDAVVVGLIGERGREVRDFLDNHVGDALPKCACVVATSDTSPVVRVRAVHAATAVAEGLRRQGLHVLLLVDSLTRVALAQREVGLSIGEPPTTRGYPPSAFALMPPLVERAGCGIKGEGSITAFYTVLVENDAVLEDPIADVVRGLLDGHIVLNRGLADRGLYPPVEILSSQSRLMMDLVDDNHQELARQGRELHSAYRDAEELITMGAYKQGSNPAVDRAITHHPAIEALVRQAPGQRISLADSVSSLNRAVTSPAGAQQ